VWLAHRIGLRTSGPDFELYTTTRGRRVLFTGLTDLDIPEVLVTCNGLRVRVRAAKDFVRMSIPRTCLDRPRWVRVGALTF
jgi:hypothetical protein